MGHKVTTIAIIGAGFSGSLVAYHLLKTSPFPLKIKLIERGTFGRGVAYSTPIACHLLNVPAGKISALPDEPQHFLNWLQARQTEYQAALVGPIAPDSFVPRTIYGDYINDLLNSAEQAAKSVKLERVSAEAIAIEDQESGAIIQLTQGEPIYADYIILALGNFPPRDPAVKDQQFYLSSRYVSYAWSPNALKEIDPQEAILLIGAGLTMVDLAMAIKERGHQGKLLVVSRHGLLPSAHRLGVTPYYKPNYRETPLPNTARGLLRKIRTEIALAQAARDDWHTVIDALRPETQQLWQQLDLGEKRRFLRHLRPYWEVHRHRIAPQVAQQLQILRDTNQLEVFAGRIISYQSVDNGVEVTIQAKGTTKQVSLTVQRVINCTGSECDYRKFQHPLIENLLSKGLIVPDELSLGLSANSVGALFNKDHEISTKFYTLGPPLKGQLWETTAVPEIRRQAQSLAQHLIAQVQPSACEHLTMDECAC